VLRHLVHHEATFADDALHRHLTVLALTDTRLLVGHTDEHTIDLGPMQAASTVEAVNLEKFTSVSLSRIVSHPEKFGTKVPARRPGSRSAGVRFGAPSSNPPGVATPTARPTTATPAPWRRRI
jgi:hypothetical protein